MQLVQEKAQKYNENGYKLASVICRQFLTDETHMYYDTEQGRFVNNLEEYMSQLNDGVIQCQLVKYQILLQGSNLNFYEKSKNG